MVPLFLLLIFITCAAVSLLLCGIARTLFPKFRSGEFKTDPHRSDLPARSREIKTIELPLVGGPAITLAIILTGIGAGVLFSFTRDQWTLLIIGLSVTLGCIVVGFIDDWQKVYSKEGLRQRTKFVAILAVSVVAPILYFFLLSRGRVPYSPYTELPIVDTLLNVKLFPFAPYVWLVLIILITGIFCSGTSLSVDSSNVLDGLAGGLVFSAALAFGIIITGTLDTPEGIVIEIFSLLCAAGTLGFLPWNWPSAWTGRPDSAKRRAKISMGSSGTLSLGGMLAMIAILSRNEIFLVLIGGVLVLEGISVLFSARLRARLMMRFSRMQLQVLRNISGRDYIPYTEFPRPFLTTSLLHRFDLLGWDRRRVVYVAWILGATFAALGVTVGLDEVGWQRWVARFLVLILAWVVWSISSWASRYSIKERQPQEEAEEQYGGKELRKQGDATDIEGDNLSLDVVDLSQKVQTSQPIFFSVSPTDNSFPASIITAEQTIKDTVEKRQDLVKDATFIYGPVQGFVQGEHNTVTLIFQDSKVHTMPFLAPPQPPYNLVGRDELIRELKQQLFHGGNLALSALNGLPGVGKTALALAIAHDREMLGHFCDGVLWAGLGRESNVFSYLGTWGMALGIPQSEMEKLTSLTMLTETIHRAIGTRRMLLVVDDAWSPKDALAFKLGGPYCAHIVTTRLPEVAERFASEGTITVRELDEDDSLRLLEQLAPGVSAKAPDEVREIIQAVDGLPLPLILLGNYLRIQMKTEQLRRLRTALDRLLQVKERLQLEQPQGGLERHPSLPEDIPLSQLAVIKISDEALDQETQQVLRSLSVFPSKPNTFSEEAALAVAATNTQTIDTLHDFGLLESSGPARYTLHQTISDYAQFNLSDPTAYERMVAFFLTYVQAHKADRDLLERETNNILAAVEIMLERGMNPPGASAFAYFIRIVRRTRTI